MRRAARVDSNHTEIVAALRQAGATVQSLASVGQGCPDALVAYRGQNYLMEFKVGKGQLTVDQMEWIQQWRGPVHVVRSAEEALRLIGAIK